MPRLFRLFTFALAFSFLLCLASGCGRNKTSVIGVPDATTKANSALFKDVATSAGLKFVHVLGNTGKFYFVEITPAGCAFFDYNNDGWLDIFLVQSGSSAPESTVHKRPTCALYSNRGDGTFVDVSSGSGIDKDLGYGHGVAVGDYDNDGFDDLFITAYGRNHLFHNERGSGRFVDVTQKMGLSQVHGDGYATSAAWGDYDNDGRLDLYVCYYSKWTHALDKQCRDPKTGLLDYCHPHLYDPETHQLFHNAGTRFNDVSVKSGINKAQGRGLAVAFVDYNDDGKQDIFVADDVTPNMLWKNNGNGTFTNVAQQAGCAFTGEGKGIAGMGIAIADYNHSGYQSFYVSNFSGDPNILFKNTGQGFFEDATGEANLAFSHLKFLSFGCEFLDYDRDGWPDLITNNGHVQMQANKREADVPLKQRNQLLHNEGKGRFREITEPSQLGDLNTPIMGRGLATGDFDNDGRVDVLAMAQNGHPKLLHNTAQDQNHWVSFQTIGTKSNRDGIHTRFELVEGKSKLIETVRAGSSYLSSSDRRVYFGLGSSSKISSVTISWPSGQRQILKDLEVDTFYTITEGKGITAKKKPNSPSLLPNAHQ